MLKRKGAGGRFLPQAVLDPFMTSPWLLQEQQAGAGTRQRHLGRRPTMLEGLFSGLDPAAGLSPSRMDAKIRLLVEAPAAVEDALASLLDHHDPVVQVAPHPEIWRHHQSATKLHDEVAEIITLP